MEQYVATFHTHLAALRSCRAVQKSGDPGARMAPVPRCLSSSCGTCLFYQGEDPLIPLLDRDLEAVYREGEKGYVLVHQAAE